MSTPQKETGPILVIGGSGVFGSRLAEGLCRDGVPDVIIAGRDLERARITAKRLGCRAIRFDMAAPDMARHLAELSPAIVIDAAGPFQSYAEDPYRLAKTAIRIGAHYLDLSDDGLFTQSIGTLDNDAKEANVVVLSGVSSVPAISAAAVRAMAHDMPTPDLIESAILPGNRAPRGTSVFRAILAQVGRPIPGTDEIGWIGTERITIDTPEGQITRLASPIGAPDLLLMQSAFKAHDVRFLAGLELPLMHRGLGTLAWLVKHRALRSALPLTQVLLAAAKALESLGSDQGGMRVRVVGTTTAGARVERTWSLLASAGDGPHVPGMPGRVLVRKLRQGQVAPGARPAIHDMTLTELQNAAPERSLSFAQHESGWFPLFETCLGKDFTRLPPPVRALHAVVRQRHWTGRAEITRGPTGLARLIAALFRFPSAAKDVRVSVHMVRSGATETWTRHFADQRFRSHLTPDTSRPGRMWERFGPFRFAIDLQADATRLSYPVSAGTCFNVPLPKWLLPRSETHEAIDDMGRATFDVALSLPLAGLIVRYRGWLTPSDQPISGDQSPAAAS